MLEKIGTPGFETISEPNTTVMRLLEGIRSTNPDPIYYEIGVGIGATARRAAEILGNRGRMVLFSRDDDVAALAADLAACGFSNADAGWGSPRNVYSGYHFELAMGFAERMLPAFDLAYVDGGHVFHLDAPAAGVLKELCRPGGYIVFDDWYWSLAKSPTMNPEKRPATALEYDARQIDTCQVQLVCKVVMNVDPRFASLGLDGATAIYRRVE
jgi:SAM-dependent methyltransferase